MPKALAIGLIAAALVVGGGLGYWLGARPADSEHPYGHARYEYLAGLAVSVMILVIGVELLKESFAKVLHPTEVAFSWLMV